MKSAATRGVICLRDPQTRVEYHVALIDYTVYEDETFEYVFTPNYSVIDLLDPSLFQGIPGLNLDLRCTQYVRKNRTPVFISERTPAENREDVRELLDAQGMGYLDQLEWLIRTSTRYTGDDLYVIRADESGGGARLNLGQVIGAADRTLGAVRAVLEAVCRGDVIEGDGVRIDDSNRAEMHALLRATYLADRSVRRAAVDAQTAARPDGRRSKLGSFHIMGVMEDYEKGRIALGEAVDRLGVSRATFFRHLKRYRELCGRE